LRVSFSSAIRNPTLTDQYLFYNVGRAILLGNINGVNELITIESFTDYLNSRNSDTLNYFNIPAIQPEKVKTIEAGYRTTLFESLYIDMGGYLSFYKDFIGYQIGLTSDFDPFIGVPRNVQALRVSSNALDKVTTQGFSIGFNYYFLRNVTINGNYSYNRLVTKTDDPIIPAFNTPEHKYNLGFSGRDLEIRIGGTKVRNLGFNINYKWIDGFIFEGSPQFTGFIPTYSLVDAQVNWRWNRMHTTFKLGASNILDNQQFQTYGGPRVGRLGYFSITYDWKKT
jgi:outer membrane cobalamin receptor